MVWNESGRRVIHQYAKAKGEVNLEQFIEREKRLQVFDWEYWLVYIMEMELGIYTFKN